jgi:phosphomannomutase
MKFDQRIAEKCAAYLQEEPNPRFRQQITTLMALDTEDAQLELYDRMNHIVRFGTAGLRAPMEAGYNRMNSVSIYRLSHALSIELGAKKRIVIGFDGREHSEDFAQEAAAILGVLGHEVYLFSTVTPTPLCAYATKNLKADVGMMITASHNPKADNGVKLYQSNSAQINGPLLYCLEHRMDAVPLLCDFMASHQKDIQSVSTKKISQQVFHDYLREIKDTRFFENQSGGEVKIVYTPLHGVGKNLFLAALLEEGFDRVLVVDAQAEPNGAFPTVIFPNPEEANTLDMAHELAYKEQVAWVFANDPDADRLQVSAPDALGSFQKISGNEMGAIFAYFAIARARVLNQKPLLASSIVSSRMVKHMCHKLSAHYVDALTGFSNIVAAALKAESETGYQFIFGYEEAIGFLVGKVVLDKDGINAGARFMEIVGYLERCNKTVWEFLDELYLEFGLFVNNQWSMRFDGIGSMDAMNRVMEMVKELDPIKISQCLGGSNCQKYDLNRSQKNNNYEGLNANVVIFESSEARLIVRPSGTEPKIKFYLELCDQATDHTILSMKRLALDHKISEYREHIEILLGG